MGADIPGGIPATAALPQLSGWVRFPTVSPPLASSLEGGRLGDLGVLTDLRQQWEAPGVWEGVCVSVKPGVCFALLSVHGVWIQALPSRLDTLKRNANLLTLDT